MRHQRNLLTGKGRSAAFGVAAMLLSGVLLSACKTLTADGGMQAVADIAGENVVAIRSDEQAAAARDKVKQLLRRPLTASAAVRVALLNNRGLQAAYNELGIAEAETVKASLPPSPTLSLQRISGNVEVEVERRIVADILALATLPARAEIAAERFREAQLRAAQETLRVGAEARRTFYRSVAALELVDFLEQGTSTAQTASALATRLGESGALNKLDQAREQVFYAEITAQLAKARQQAASEREGLIRALGLWGEDITFKLPHTLPPLPARPRTLPAVETQSVTRRIDLQIGRIELAALAKSYGLTDATRFINLLNVSAVSKTTDRKPTVENPVGEHIRDLGPDVEFQIPLFDFGEVRLRTAEQSYMQAVNRLVEMAVNARSQARQAYQTYRSAYDIAAHYRNEVLPLRKIISDETILRYNAMMIDVFGLLTEARERTASTGNAIEAERDFWLASVDLDDAILVGSRNVTGPSQASVDPSNNQ
jgi:outer membrane protein TolC